jgi:glucose 1-dehydrogenase
LLDTIEADFNEVMATNMKSAFFGTQAAAKQFISLGGGGLVLNTSSVHEDWPMPGNIAYCVSKGGIRMLTRTAGVELGSHGIRVVNIAPGRGRHADQRLDRGRPRETESPRRCHSARADGAIRRDC